MSAFPAPGEAHGPLEANGGRSREYLGREYLEELDSHVQALRREALDLRRQAGGMQAFTRNTERILASVRMLEINLSDLLDRPSMPACWEEEEQGPGEG